MPPVSCDDPADAAAAGIRRGTQGRAVGEEDTAAEPGAVAAVVIGRNEGARLVACLRSLAPDVARIVYVDSGSTDGSVEAARSAGAEVVELGPDVRFTAARARNAGFQALLSGGPAPAFVQFVDGDCSVVPDWIAAGTAALAADPGLGAVAGRRREARPEASVYNRLCDAEWDTPVGEALAVGGDAMIRTAALRAIGGYRPDLIAGEEPEMCLRLRRAGWRILRLDRDMTLHDAAMLRFGQWWRRTRRAGYAFAEGASLHGNGPERHWVAETRRALLWGLGLPAAAVAAGAVSPVAGGALLLAYPLQALRLTPRLGAVRAAFTVLGRFPEGLGAAEFHLRRAARAQGRGLIEYK